MKKYILSILLLTSTALASENLYIKIGTGLNSINPVAIQTNDFNGKIKLANKFPSIYTGLGYQLTDSIRTELVFDHYFLFHSKEKTVSSWGDVFNIDYKTKISALMLNGFKDIITVGIFTPYIGGGIGVSFLYDKATGSGKNVENETFELLNSASSQQVNRFAYRLTFGLDTRLNDTTTFDLNYNYINLGRNRPKVTDGVNEMIARDYLVHNLTASIRFNF